ncbi:hypothetical protein H7Y29_02040 [Microbacteriaceae bacterium]|nr:hypothetical protein [Candidatus Saccharibacteria bacterium]
MNKIKVIIISAFAVLGLGLMASPAYAATCRTSAECIKAGVSASGGTSSKTDIGDLIKTVVSVLLFLLGAIAVIMIVIGGIKYTTSNGDSSAVTSAKNTILYAVVGLIVALMAYAIVNFIVDKFV